MSLPSPIVEYLTALETSTVANSHITRLANLIHDLLGPEDQIQRLFISEYVDRNGKRVYESAWFFTEKQAFEAREFLSENMDLDCLIFREAVRYFRTEMLDFDPPNPATQSSRMSLSLGFYPGGGDIKASGANCDYLYAILKEVFLPNMRAPVVPKDGI